MMHNYRTEVSGTSSRIYKLWYIDINDMGIEASPEPINCTMLYYVTITIDVFSSYGVFCMMLTQRSFDLAP